VIASGPDSLLLERRLLEPLGLRLPELLPELRLVELRLPELPLPPELPLLLRFGVLRRSAIG
jgi:hypothetical protein